MLVRRRAAPPSSSLAGEHTARGFVVGGKRVRNVGGRAEGDERKMGGRRVRSAIEQEGYHHGRRWRRGERLRETVSPLRPAEPLACVVVVVRAPLVADEQIRVMGGRNIDLG